MEFDVAAEVKIYIDDPNKIGEVKSELEKIVKVQRAWEEDIGFGIKVLKAVLLFSDSAGGMEQLEQKIKKIPHVSEFETENVSRV